MNNLLLTLMIMSDDALDRLRKRREAGQGSLEYVGMIAIAALLVVGLVAVFGTLGTSLTGVVNKAITKIQTIIP